MKVVHAPVGNQGLDPRLERRRPRREIAAETDAHQRDLFRIHLRQLQREVKHRRDNLLPVRPERQLLLANHRSLPRPLEHQAVVSALQREHRDLRVKLFNRSIKPRMNHQ